MKQAVWFVAAVALLASASSQAEAGLAEVNQPAPPFRLPAYNPAPGAPPLVGLDQFVGPTAKDAGVKLVVLSFMASFCAPCQKELPQLERLRARYHDAGLRVMSVAIDTDPAGQQRVGELVAENKVAFPVLKDRFRLVARRWLGSQSPLPSVFLIRPDGTIAAVHRGYDAQAFAALSSEIIAALGLPPDPPPAPKPAHSHARKKK